MTEIMKCSGCKPHPYQDEIYGKNQRVFNQKADGGWTCTICGTKKGPTGNSLKIPTLGEDNAT